MKNYQCIGLGHLPAGSTAWQRVGWWCAGSTTNRWAVVAFLIFTQFLIQPAFAQEYTRRPPDLDRFTQELFAEIQSDDVPYEDLYETLLQYYQTPINLNTATREELRA